MAKPLIRNSKSTDQLSAEQSVRLSVCLADRLSAQLPPRSPPHPVIDQNHPYRPPPLPRIFPARAMSAGRAAASASAEVAVDGGALMETAAAATRRSVKWCFIELLCTRAWSGDGGRRMGPLKRHHSGPDRRTGTGHRIGDAELWSEGVWDRAAGVERAAGTRQRVCRQRSSECDAGRPAPETEFVYCIGSHRVIT